MAENITLFGTAYTGVTSVTLPKTGGGVATFTTPTQTATGTFTGDGTRQADIPCTFEPDIVYWNSDPGSEASSGSVAGCIVRDLWASSVYRNNAATNSVNTQIAVTGMNTNGSSYNFKATYADGTVTLYCFSNNARSKFTDNRTYSYTFIKYTP